MLKKLQVLRLNKHNHISNKSIIIFDTLTCLHHYQLYATFTDQLVPILLQAMALGLQLVSAYWFYKIVRMVRFKLNNRSTLKNS